MPRSMKIAIIGAGMAGLTCGGQLRRSGHDVSMFDKGRGAGGRMATRRIEQGGQTFRFDHGAQYFTARDPAFVERVREWEREGIVARWPAAGEGAWVGTPAMNAPIRAMADTLDVQFGRRIESIARAGSGGDDGWRLVGKGAPDMRFDAVVVAVPAEQAGPLLEPHSANLADLAHWVASAPCWAAMVAFDVRLDAPDTISDAFPSDSPLAWAARNSSKPGRNAAQECWVLHATPEWSRRNLERKEDEVRDELLTALEAHVGPLRQVVMSSAHRWRYAMCEKNDTGAVWDAQLRLGACGDWTSGPRVENAFLSGHALAGKIAG